MCVCVCVCVCACVCVFVHVGVGVGVCTQYIHTQRPFHVVPTYYIHSAKFKLE